MRKVWFVPVLGVLGISLLCASHVVAAVTGCDASKCITSHDTIPNFAGHPTLSSIRSGAWSAPTTWNLGRVPSALDIVQISSGTTVTYDLPNGYAQVVGIQANAVLTFRTDINTRLTVDTVLVLPQGAFYVGTEVAPVNAGVVAEIIIADQPLDTINDGLGTFDPSQYGTGLLAVNGEVVMSGAAKTSFVRLAVEPRVGDVTLQLATPVSGWQPGDRLILPDSRHYSIEVGGPYAYAGEEAILSSVSANGTVATLQQPLRFDHPGARDGNGILEFLPHVGNLSRNVVVRSENPTGTRGHVLVTEESDVDIRYVAFRNLGRTTIDPLDNTTLDAQGQVSHLGTNQIGRYPLHMHHVMGPTPTPANGYQFTLIGNAVVDDTRNQRHKWAMAIHDSHYGLIQDNVVYNAAGWGIGTEDGSESFNEFTHNFVTQVRGIGGRDTSEMGVGIWMRGPNNYVRDNTVNNVMGVEGGGGYGYALFFFYLGQIRVPTSKGADTSITGQYTTVDGNATPLLEFARNETYGTTETGLTIWWLGTVAETIRSVSTSTVKDFRVWNHMRYGYYGYHSTQLVLDGFVARGNASVVNNQVGTPVGITFADYMQNNPIIRNANIQNMRTGIDTSSFIKGQITIENSYLWNASNIDVTTIGAPGSAPFGPAMPPKTTLIQDVLFARMSTPLAQPSYDISMLYSLHSDASNLIQSDTVFVYSYNQVPGDDFQVLYYEQRPDFIVPQSSGNLAGSPVAGLTNTQNWSTYGIAIAGAVATNVTTRPSVYGYVRDGTPSTGSSAVPPSLITQPVNRTVSVGQSATFSVIATGTAPLFYQWQKNGTPIAGATAASYTTPSTVSTDSGATFRCVVSNAVGTATSTAATLTVTTSTSTGPPSITTQPANRTVSVGQSATFSVTATGTAPLTYQWQKNGKSIAGATAASYTTPPTVQTDNGATFRCVVSNAAGTATSNAATLTVTTSTSAVSPSITTQPVSKTVLFGQSATFSVTATGTAPLTYQWQRSGTPIAGATSASYTIPSVNLETNGYIYRCVVSNAAGTATSTTATLTVLAPPSMTTQPVNRTVNLGQSATFSVTATGTAPLTYQWQKNGKSIAGATAASYTTPPTVQTDNGATFRCVVSNAVGTVTSNTATLMVLVPPSITTQPANQTVSAGKSATFSVAATGTTPLKYQWQKNGVSIAGATAASYTTPSTVQADSGTPYRCVVSNVAGTVTSNAATLTVR